MNLSAMPCAGHLIYGGPISGYPAEWAGFVGE